MFLFFTIDDFYCGRFIGCLIVECIKRKLLLLEEGDISFESDTIESEVAVEVELLHDLFSEFEDGVISG